MLTEKRIEEELRPIKGLDWITALRAPQIQKLASDGALQLSLFDQRDLAEITHPDYPNERLIVCRNPLSGPSRRLALTCSHKNLPPVGTTPMHSTRSVQNPRLPGH